MYILKLFIAICIFSTGLIIAQSQFIDIYGNRITLGMSRENIKNLFKNDYKIVEKDNFYMLYTKSDNLLVGSFGFENNSLYVANRYWDIYSFEDAIEFGDVLYSLLSKVQNEGLQNAVVTTSIQDEPNGTYKKLTIDYGDKEINITIKDKKSFKIIDLVETLFRVP